MNGCDDGLSAALNLRGSEPFARLRDGILDKLLSFDQLFTSMEEESERSRFTRKKEKY
jgi:hypothetical protein